MYEVSNIIKNQPLDEDELKLIVKSKKRGKLFIPIVLIMKRKEKNKLVNKHI